MARGPRNFIRGRRYRRRRGIPTIGSIADARRLRQMLFRRATSTRFFKIRITENVSSDASGVISITMNNNPTSYTEWTSLATLFDSFKINTMVLKFVPDKPNDTSTVTGYKPIYVFGDPDSAAIPISSVDHALQYENCKVKNLYRPWSYKYSPPDPTAISGGVIVLQNGFRDVGSPTAYAGIFAYSDGLDISDNYGTVIKTLYCEFKNRR